MAFFKSQGRTGEPFIITEMPPLIQVLYLATLFHLISTTSAEKVGLSGFTGEQTQTAKGQFYFPN